MEAKLVFLANQMVMDYTNKLIVWIGIIAGMFMALSWVWNFVLARKLLQHDIDKVKASLDKKIDEAKAYANESRCFGIWAHGIFAKEKGRFVSAFKIFTEALYVGQGVLVMRDTDVLIRNIKDMLGKLSRTTPDKLSVGDIKKIDGWLNNIKIDVHQDLIEEIKEEFNKKAKDLITERM